VYLIFKLLNVRKTGSLSEDEFTSIYEVISLKWKVVSVFFAFFVFVYLHCMFLLHVVAQ